jgi:hypothetical protein
MINATAGHGPWRQARDSAASQRHGNLNQGPKRTTNALLLVPPMARPRGFPMVRMLSFLAVLALCAVVALSGNPAGAQGKGGKAKHKHIEAAIKALELAKQELKEASHDFGGHRQSALGASDAAILELKEALKFADTKKTETKKQVR